MGARICGDFRAGLARASGKRWWKSVEVTAIHRETHATDGARFAAAYVVLRRAARWPLRGERGGYRACALPASATAISSARAGRSFFCPTVLTGRGTLKRRLPRKSERRGERRGVLNRAVTTRLRLCRMAGAVAEPRRLCVARLHVRGGIAWQPCRVPSGFLVSDLGVSDVGWTVACGGAQLAVVGAVSGGEVRLVQLHRSLARRDRAQG